MQEIWKDCIHYEGLYQVSNYGRVKSLERDTYALNGTVNGHIKEHIVPQQDNGHGYQTVSLTKFGKTRKEYVHRLVAMAFIPNPENKPQVDHINTDKADNVVTNLRWVTQSENNKNELTLARMIINSKLSKRVRCIETGEEFISTQEVARKFGKKGIRDHLMGKNKSYCGYHWEYIGGKTC